MYRVFFFSLPACNEPLGMESQRVGNNYIMASDWKIGYNPYKARLNGGSGWLAYANRQRWPFIQVKVSSDGGYTVTGVATQPVGGYAVNSFTLTYSFDGIDWVDYREDGNVKVRGLLFNCQNGPLNGFAGKRTHSEGQNFRDWLEARRIFQVL